MKKTIIITILVVLIGIIGTMGIFIKALLGDVKELKREYDKQVETVDTLKETNTEMKEYMEELQYNSDMNKMFERN